MTTRTLTRLLPVAAVSVVLAGLAVALPMPRQSKQPTREEPAWLSRLQQWLEAVRQHEPGSEDAPALAISTWSGGEAQAVLSDLLELRHLLMKAHAQRQKKPTGPPPVVTFRSWSAGMLETERLLGISSDEARRGDINRLMKRGALLHTDIAVLIPPQTIPPFGGGLPQQNVLVARDGRQVGVQGGAVHWDFARTLLGRVTPDPSRDDVVRLWYRATAAYLEAHYVFSEAVPHLRRARQLFPADADILFDSGCLHETFAAPRVQSVIRSAVVPTSVTTDAVSPQDHLREAERLFRQAVRINPELIQARVRLGRVIGLQGRHDEAAGELRRAIAAIPDALLMYYAEMFLGDEEQALGHRDAAGKCYEHAAALFRSAQSPRLALSQLARRHGDRSGALAAIQPVFALSPHQATRADPWWEYDVVPFRNADDLLTAWRGLFPREEER